MFLNECLYLIVLVYSFTRMENLSQENEGHKELNNSSSYFIVFQKIHSFERSIGVASGSCRRSEQ